LGTHIFHETDLWGEVADLRRHPDRKAPAVDQHRNGGPGGHDVRRHSLDGLFHSRISFNPIHKTENGKTGEVDGPMHPFCGQILKTDPEERQIGPPAAEGSRQIRPKRVAGGFHGDDVNPAAHAAGSAGEKP
jgi:hypothetical protein